MNIIIMNYVQVSRIYLNTLLTMVQNYLLNCDNNRDIIIDASLLGMGRIPGNLPIELICSYLNNNNKSYDIAPIYDWIEIYGSGTNFP